MQTAEIKFLEIELKIEREKFARFQDLSTKSSKIDVFSDPFSVSHEDSDAALQMKLIELQCDSTLHHYSNDDLLTHTNIYST